MPTTNDVDVLSKPEHWETVWIRAQLPKIINPNGRADHRTYHRVFSECLESMGKEPRVLEVGCAASAWLPYFRKHHGCEVFGVDYSPEGVRLARDNLAMQGLAGEVELEDILGEHRAFPHKFDMVVSFGLVEHFDPPDHVLRQIAMYVRPGGVLATQIPNLRGIFGWGLWLFRRDLYDIHIPMSLAQLAMFHERAGLERVQIPGYVGGLHLNMTLSSVVPKGWPRLVRAGIATVADIVSRIVSPLLSWRLFRWARRWLVPDLFVVYRKPL